MTIRSCLAAIMIGGALVIVGLGTMSILSLRSIDEAVSHLRDQEVPMLNAVGDLRYAVTRYRLIGGRYIMTVGKSEIAEIDRAMTEMSGHVNHAIQKVSSHLDTPDERNLWQQFQAHWASYLPVQKRFVDLAVAAQKVKAASAALVA